MSRTCLRMHICISMYTNIEVGMCSLSTLYMSQHLWIITFQCVNKYDPVYVGLNVKHLGHTVECQFSERLSTEPLSE